MGRGKEASIEILLEINFNFILLAERKSVVQRAYFYFPKSGVSGMKAEENLACVTHCELIELRLRQNLDPGLL